MSKLFRFNKDLVLVCSASFIRSLAVSCASVLLGIYLAERGLNLTEIGIVITAGLFGSGLSTLLAGLWGEGFGRKNFLILTSIFMALGGFAMAFAQNFPFILIASFAGFVNGQGRDRGPQNAIDQAIIPDIGTDSERTKSFVWYQIILDAGTSIGALAGALPYIVRKWTGISAMESYQWTFAAYGLLIASNIFIYSALSEKVEVKHEHRNIKISPESRSVIMKLAALFGLDSFGGGFLTSALISYWFYTRFGTGEEYLGPMFFIARTLNVASYMASFWLSKRIGLVRTMVFTHIPASLLMITAAFMPDFWIAAILFLARESLSSMDIPARQSYIMSVVKPSERTFTAGVTNVTRNLGTALGPSIAGFSMQMVSMTFPLLFGSSLKIIYDVLLYQSFRHLKPPEEC